MIIDGLLQFTGTAGVAGSLDNPTAGTQFSTNVIDLLNARDMGIGDKPTLKLSVSVVTPFAGGTSLQILVQGSVDNTTYITMATGPVITEANLQVGTFLFDIGWPRIVGPFGDKPGASQALPRYIRLAYVSVGTHTGGGIFAAMVLDRQDQISYPPGIVIAN